MENIDQIIYDTAIAKGFNPKAAKLIAAQARFESADYTSGVFRANNNTSGIKYIGSSQKNAQRGSLAPMSERSASCRGGGNCVNSDHYAKFNTIQDSLNDKIVRLYSLTMGGVTPQQLKDVTDATEFATLLKKRSYYGATPYGTSQANADIRNYASGLKTKLLKINILEFVKKNKTPLSVLGLGLVLLSGGIYYYLKLKKR